MSAMNPQLIMPRVVQYLRRNAHHTSFFNRTGRVLCTGLTRKVCFVKNVRHHPCTSILICYVIHVYLSVNCSKHGGIKLYSKQPLRPLQCKIIDVHCTSNHILAIGNGWWSTIVISRDDILCHFCSYNATTENEACYVLGCPIYNSIRNKVPSQYENPSSTKSHFTHNQE